MIQNGSFALHFCTALHVAHDLIPLYFGGCKKFDFFLKNLERSQAVPANSKELCYSRYFESAGKKGINQSRVLRFRFLFHELPDSIV